MDLCPHCLRVTLQDLGCDENEQPIVKCGNCGHPGDTSKWDAEDAKTSSEQRLQAAEHLMGEPITDVSPMCEYCGSSTHHTSECHAFLVGSTWNPNN